MIKIIEWLKKHSKSIIAAFCALIGIIFVYVVFLITGKVIGENKKNKYNEKKDKLKEEKDKDEEIIHSHTSDSYNNDGTIK